MRKSSTNTPFSYKYRIRYYYLPAKEVGAVDNDWVIIDNIYSGPHELHIQVETETQKIMFYLQPGQHMLRFIQVLIF